MNDETKTPPAPEKCWIANVGEGVAEKWEAEADTVCISITEPKRPERARLPKGFKDVLRVEFQDYDGERKHPEGAILFTPTQAAQVARFARKYRGLNFLVHCAGGVSRSAAVAEALIEAFPEYTDKGGKRFPNGHVKRLMKRALGLVPIGADDFPSPAPTVQREQTILTGKADRPHGNDSAVNVRTASEIPLRPDHSAPAPQRCDEQRPQRGTEEKCWHREGLFCHYKCAAQLATMREQRDDNYEGLTKKDATIAGLREELSKAKNDYERYAKDSSTNAELNLDALSTATSSLSRLRQCEEANERFRSVMKQIRLDELEPDTFDRVVAALAAPREVSS